MYPLLEGAPRWHHRWTLIVSAMWQLQKCRPSRSPFADSVVEIDINPVRAGC